MLSGLKEVSEEMVDVINCTQLNMLENNFGGKILVSSLCFQYYSENKVSMLKKKKKKKRTKTEDLYYLDLNKRIHIRRANLKSLQIHQSF